MKLVALSVFLALASLCCFADLKASNRTVTAGHTVDSTVLVKDGKMRTETAAGPGLSIVTIQDCSTRRLIQINDRTHSYMESASVEDEKPSNAANDGAMTVTINHQDTGERKTLLGYSARHIKGTITTEGRGSCSTNMHATTDGWYIDLPEIHGCAPQRSFSFLAVGNGCTAGMHINSAGVERPGFPVVLDTAFDSNGNASHVHQETTAISTQTLDPGLFEVPAGYKKVDSYQALMGFPGGNAGGTPMLPSQSSTAATAAAQATLEKDTPAQSRQVLRIGVAQIRSIVSQSLGTDGWQQELVNDIDFLGGKGIVLSSDPNDREATLDEAKQNKCDYVVFTTVNNYRSVSVGQKIGNVLGGGRLGGVGGTGQGRVEISAQVEVFQPDIVTPVFNGSDDFRQNDAEGTARGLLHTEARDVMLQIRKLRATQENPSEPK